MKRSYTQIKKKGNLFFHFVLTVVKQQQQKTENLKVLSLSAMCVCFLLFSLVFQRKFISMPIMGFFRISVNTFRLWMRVVVSFYCCWYEWTGFLLRFSFSSFLYICFSFASDNIMLAFYFCVMFCLCRTQFTHRWMFIWFSLKLFI